MAELLASIDSPQDVKKLNRSQLPQLCAEIREELLNQVSQTGGHLASNLGVVELTVALHYVLNCPQDKIIWDVGHQAYVHKMLTGRRNQMPLLRQFQGMSGFPKRSESEYDAFGCGHSSTALSAALGMSIARDALKEDYQVVAVVGDGAMTGGMSLEGLNHAGHEKRNLLLVLNDNAMSISPNEGALSSYLNRLRSHPRYWNTKNKISDCLKEIPVIGKTVEATLRLFKELVRYAALKKSTVFEELGWSYIGPVDGHDLENLIDVLQNTVQLQGPVLLHVITKKGKGYLPAEENPDKFHGIGNFDIATGQSKFSGEKTYTGIFTDFIMQQGRINPKVVAITAAMASGTGLNAFAQSYPERFFDVGICEQHAVTLAAGMACQGLHPVVCLYSTFLQRAIDQVIHDVALQNLPVLFAIDRAGLVGEDGATHQGVFDVSLLRDIPNLKIYCPANGRELYQVLLGAIESASPVVVRYPRGVAAKPCRLENLPAQILLHWFDRAVWMEKGRDIVLMGIGKGYGLAEQVAYQLKKEGFQPGLLKFTAIKPLDEASVLQAAAYQRIVTIEDAALIGGFGSAVLECLSEQGCTADVLRIGLPDQFVEQGKVEQLWQMLEMNPEQIRMRIFQRWHNLKPSTKE